MAADVPLRVKINSVAEDRKMAQLGEVAAKVKLVELMSGLEIPCNVTVHEEQKNAFGEFGYPTRVPAYVGIEPRDRLDPAKWYELQIVPLPSDVVPMPLGARTLEGPGASARFSPGSHPTLVAVRRCARDGGGQGVDLDFSENLEADAGIKGRVSIGQIDRPSGCSLRLPPSGIARVLHFSCEGGVESSSGFQLSVDGSVTSTSGGKFELPLQGPKAFSARIDAVMWRAYEHGCYVWAI